MQRLANPLFLKAFSNGYRRIACCCVVLVTVAGCALLRPEPKLEVPDVGGFAVKGRMAVRNGDDGFASSFVWQHAVGRDEIDLWGPLGQGHSRLVGEGDAVTVYTAKGEVYRERDADAAMQRWLGFSLPMTALTHWIRGEQAPGYPVDGTSSDAAGDLASLDQLSWRLEFSGYQPFDGGARLPARIIAVRGNVRVTLLPAEWSFGAQNAFDTP
jgi:outer membrane lipoprotein LolB